MLTRTAALALLLAASGAAGCKPDRSKPLPLTDAGTGEAAPDQGAVRAPIASGGGDQAAPAADAGTSTAEPAGGDAGTPTGGASTGEPATRPPDRPATGGKDDEQGAAPAVKKPRNVKALPASWTTRQVTEYMKKQVARGLGAECDHCHDTSDFAADGNEHKRAARAMLRMTGELNRLYFRGKSVITCFTCHRGKPEPGRK